MSSGEVAAMVIFEAAFRLIEGVINGESLSEESFSEGLLEYPHYTRPEVFRGERVPDVLLSGHHKRIERWRRAQRILRTLKRRPDLIERDNLAYSDRELLAEWEKESSSDE